MSNRRPRDEAASARRPRLKKALGQHHLRSPELCRPAVEYLTAVRSAGCVLEIGPGGGVLTEALLGAGFEVLAVELDREWAFELRRRHSFGRRAGNPAPEHLQVAVGDALDLCYAGLAAAAGAPGAAAWSIAGNLPYAVSTAIVERILDQAPAGTRCAFLVQREVADRLLAEPGSRTYGSLSVLVSLRARGLRLARVRPGSFHPPPRVESAFVGLEILPRRPPASGTGSSGDRASARAGDEAEEWHALKTTVRAAFEQRRKTLANVLSAGFGSQRAHRALAECGIDGRLRAETLAPERFVDLHAALGRSAGEAPS